MPVSKPVRIVTGCNNSMPVRIVTAGGDPVRIVTEGVSDPVRVVTSGLSTPVVVISGSTPPTPPGPDAPTFVSAEVGNVDGQTVVVVFSVAITANGGDYGVGFTILVNAAPNAVTAFNHSAGDTIQLTLTTCVNYGDTVTIAYDDSAGQIHESTGVTPLATFGAQAVTNNVAWYRSGCAPVPVAVYQPKGAADLAASYINLANPGTYDAAPGTAPTWDIVNGWKFAAASSQYLTTGVIPGPLPGWSFLVRYSSVPPASSNTLLGEYDNSAPQGYFILQPQTTLMRTFSSGTTTQYADNGPILLSGIYGVADLVPYRNGVAEANAITNTVASTPNQDIYIGGLNLNGSPAQYLTVDIQAFVVWNTSTGHATWMPAVSAAAALL